jgi:acyl dehydratase
MTDSYTRRPTAADVSVGDAAPEVVVEDIQRKDFVKYAGASGDFNPIHYDEPYAQEAGNESVFGQGMLTAGYAAHMVADWFGTDRVTRFKIRFRSRLWPGDTVSVTGEIVDVERSDDGAVVTAEFAVTNGDGDRLLTGDAEANLPR